MAPPRPKIPTEYAKVAEKLSSELAPSGGGAVSEYLSKLAGDLSSNLESRSAPLASEGMQSVKTAGVFDATENTKTPDVKDKTPLDVYMDSILGKTGEPKSVEGTGAMYPALNPKTESGLDINNGYVNKYDPKSGVLMDSGVYTPTQKTPYPEDYPLTPRSGRRVASEIRIENETRNETERVHEFTHPESPQLFLNKPVKDGSRWNQIDNGFVENIPAAVGGIVGAGIALASTNTQARERPLSEELQLDYSSSKPKDAIPAGNIPNKERISLLGGKTDAEQSESLKAKPRLVTNNIIEEEIAKLGEAVLYGAKTSAGAVKSVIQDKFSGYQAEKHNLDIKAAQLITQWETDSGKAANLSDTDKELFRSVVGAVEGNGLSVPFNAASIVPQATSTIAKKVNDNALKPIWKAVQGAIRGNTGPEQYATILRQNAPSIAILAETAFLPLIGSTGWNVGEYGPVSNPDADPLASLDPSARKILNDKQYFLGTEAGAATLAVVSQFRDLPLWLIGGSSKLGLFLGGMANETTKDNPEFVEGGMGGVMFGTGIEKAAGAFANTKVAQKGISLLGKAKENLVFKFGETLSDISVKKFSAQRAVEPLIFITDTAATKMADEAASKIDLTVIPDKAPFKPQVVLLDVGDDGIPKVFGRANERYVALGENLGHIGDNGENVPVIISSRARRLWVENELLRNRFHFLIGEDVRPTTADDIGDWTNDLIPPNNPSLVFAWENRDKDGMLNVYRAGSNAFNARLLRSRSLAVVHYDGPNGEPATGLGFMSPSGAVIAPDPSEGIPGAIPRDLIFKQVRLDPSIPASGVLPENQAWEIRPIDDIQALMNISREIKAGNDIRIETEAEVARGNMFPDGVPLPQNRPPAPFDNVGLNPLEGIQTVNLRGGGSHLNPETGRPDDLNFGFLPIAKQQIAKGLTKVNNAMGKAGLISDTTYGEKFKIDASIQAFSLRHFKRYVDDLGKQLNMAFTDAASTPTSRKQFNEDLRAYIEGRQTSAPAQLTPEIQQKVNKYITDRNADYALIQQLGGDAPKAAAGGNAELEKLFALDYLTPAEWVARMPENQRNNDSLMTLLKEPKSSHRGINLRNGTYSNISGISDETLGRFTPEREMAVDYMKRKRAVTQLLVMKELADNPQASSSTNNVALGHDYPVNFSGAGMLNGKYVSKETYDAIHTYPAQQKMLQNDMLGFVNAIKYNKTVLNPMTWAKNVMGNVWGVMNSNIVPTWAMAHRMPKGIKRMRKDLTEFNADIMSDSAAVKRVHETLKYGLLGAEFESSRNKMGDALAHLETPGKLSWGEKMSEMFSKGKDNTAGALGNLYSKVDMATKYSLYVNGLERWGIDLGTNTLGTTSQARLAAGSLLGNTTIAGITDDAIADLVKREVVRRIHLSLPMVDRIGTWATRASKLSPVTNPWLRTATELMRVTMQMPYRMANEKGYATNMAGTALALGTVYGVNKMLRLNEGISDEMVDDALAIAPDNIKRYMPGATATMFRAEDGGIVFIDLADMLVEPLQWFKGGEQQNMPQRFGANMIDTVFGGGLLQDQSRQAQAAMGLVDEPQAYNKPFWKQESGTRAAIDLSTRLGPQVFNNMWNLYNTAEMPARKTVRGAKELRQPLSMQALKMMGIDVASFGTEEQKNYKLKQLTAEKKRLNAEKKSVNKQVEGSSTGPFQPAFNKKENKEKINLKRKEITQEKIDLRKHKATPKP